MEQLEPRHLLAGDFPFAEVARLSDGVDFASGPDEDALMLTGDGIVIPQRSYVPGEIMVGLRSDNPQPNPEVLLSDYRMPGEIGNVTPDNTDTIFSVRSPTTGFVNVTRIGLPEGRDVLRAVAALESLPFVEYAAPNYIYQDLLELTPNDPEFPAQYHHPLMENPTAWNTTLGDPSIVIAVTDTGVDWHHEDLAGSIWINADEVIDGTDSDGNGYVDDIRGWDVFDGDNNPDEGSGSYHGTHVAGIAAAMTNNGKGVSGTAGGATIMPIRVGEFVTSSIFAEAFIYAASNGAHIANTSFNIDSMVDDPTFASALQFMYDQGVLHFNSAGNNNQYNPPRQQLDQSLFVASTDSSDIRSYFSNFGDGIDIAAPGSAVLSTLPNDQYGTLSGTSMASPNAAGVAALIWSAHPTWTRDQVAAQLVGTADNINAANPDFGDLLGSGRANSAHGVSSPLAPPQIDGIREVRPGSEPAAFRVDGLTVQLGAVFGKASIESPLNWELRSDGADNVFHTADDAIIPLTLETDYMVGSNAIEFSNPLLPNEHYRFTARAGGLVDPFGTALDGNGDGIAGDDFVQEFTVFDLPAPSPFVVNSTGDGVDAFPGDGIAETRDGVTTLRAAVQEANALGGAQTIILTGGQNHTLTIPGNDDFAMFGDLDILADITITGTGPGLAVIDAGGNGGLGDRIFDVYGSLNVHGLRITGGVTPNDDFGGGIRNWGSLFVNGSTFSNNTARTSSGFGGDGGAILNAPSSTATIQSSSFIDNFAADDGGAIRNDGSLEIMGSLFSSNTAGDSAGAIYNLENGTLTVIDSTLESNSAQLAGGLLNLSDGAVVLDHVTFDHNTVLSINSGSGNIGDGAAIYNSGPDMYVSHSTLINNQAGDDGGAIRNEGTLTLHRSLVSDNEAADGGGGIYNLFGGVIQMTASSITSNAAERGGGLLDLGEDEVTIQDSTFRANTATSGGGIDQRGIGALTVEGSTFRDNVADVGGGVYALGDGTRATFARSTFSGNRAQAGAGLRVDAVAEVTLSSVTITANTGLGVSAMGGGINNSGFLTLQNTIVSGNTTGGGTSRDIHNQRTVQSAGHNLLGDIGGSAGVTLDPTDVSSANPQLDVLQDNGGPTFTHAVLPGSPARNAGERGGQFVDQRGVDATDAQDDIGAFEVASSTHAPNAELLDLVGYRDETLNGQLFAVDPDTPMAELVFSKQSNPGNGSASVSTDGSFSYTPNPGFSGADFFLFDVSDGTHVDGGAVSIRVLDAQAGPPAEPVVEFSAATYQVDETVGNSSVVTLVRTGNIETSSQVLVRILGGTAVDGADYDGDAFPLTVTFAPSVTSRTIIVPIVNDSLAEATERIILEVTPASNVRIGSNSLTFLHIVDDDSSAENVEDFETGDFSQFPWTHSGDEAWHVTSSQRHGGVYSARSGDGLTDDQSSILELTLTTAPGEVSFWRKVSSENQFDFLRFSIDGQLHQQWSGEVDWGQVTYPVPPGLHTFTWEYVKDGSVSLGSDAAWVDDIFLPVGEDTTPPTVTDIVPPDGATIWSPSVNIDITFSEPVAGVDETDLELTGAAAASAAVGIPHHEGGTTWRFPVTFLADGPLNLNLAPDAGDIQDSAGNDLTPAAWSYDVSTSVVENVENFETGDFSLFPWSFAGDAGWVITGAQRHGGTSSARAGTITHSQTSTLQVALMTVAGDISFWRKVSSESNYDFLRFSIDGQLQEQWSGESDWEQETYAVSAGAHTFSWEYAKDSSVSRGSDTGWIDDIVFPIGEDTTRPTVIDIVPAAGSAITSTSVNVNVTFSEPVQGVDASDLELSGAASGSATVGTPSHPSGNTWQFPISGLVDGGLTLSLAPDAHDIQDASGNDLVPESWGYTVSTSIAGNTIEDFETGDFSQFPWTHTGNAAWIVTNGQQHGGAHSARPGPITDGQTSGLQVTMTTNAGDISFWRMVSSEDRYDHLRFFIDGQMQAEWSGEVVWGQETYPVSAGLHTFSWEYVKDGSVSRGADTAWLDDITFPIGEDTTPPTVTQIVPADGATIPSSSVTVSITFSEPVEGVDASDLELAGTGSGSATVGAPSHPSGNTWQFPISGLVDGGLSLNLAPDANDIQDPSGNDLAPTSWSYTVSTSIAGTVEDFETGDFSQFPWTHTGNAAWIVTSGQQHGGAHSARPGSITDDQTSGLEVTLTTTAGDISFWRKVSSENRYDFLRFFIDGQMQEAWSGEVEWGQATYPVSAGLHTFSWEYAKDGSVSRGADTAWLDDVAFPSGEDTTPPTVTEIVPSDGATIASSSVNVNITFSEPVEGVDASDLELAGTASGSASVGAPSHPSGNTWQFPISGLVDGGLSLSLAPDANDIQDPSGNDLAPTSWSYTVSTSITGTVEDFETGDFSQFPWTHTGNAAWIVTNAQPHGGAHSARPGSITDLQASGLQVTMTTTAGDISFWRKVSSENRYDFLRFFIDGQMQAEWSGEVDWGHETYAVSAGLHTFSWEYAKDGSVSRGADTAWLDDIAFPIGEDTTPPTVTEIVPAAGSTIASSSVNVNITFSEPVEGVGASDLELSGTAAGSATVGALSNPSGNTWQFLISGLVDGGLVLNLAPDANDIQDLAGNDLAPTSWSYTVSTSISGNIEDFETGDFSQFPWTHTGDAAWIVTNAQQHGGALSAGSGSITHDQTSGLQVTIPTAAGDISFWRKVSSENRYDYLRFFIDGQIQEQWSGEVDWGQASYPVSAGLHTFSWEYAKDRSVSRGADAGWIDDIVFPEVQSSSSVQFVVNYSGGADEGFFDPGLGSSRQEAFEYALGIWGETLSAAYPGETITVDASMDAMGGTGSSAILGSAGSPSIHADYDGMVPDTWYGAALANHLAGYDVFHLTEVVARFNSDVDNSTVLGTTDWYYGLDANPGGDIDFVTVALHEIGHGLNFFDLLHSDGSWSQDDPGIYDRQLETGGGSRLVDMASAGARATVLVSDDLWWGGSEGTAGNGGVRPKMYAPISYRPGSSTSHLDETVHGGDLMSPIHSGPDHEVSAKELGILIDMGWSIVGQASPEKLVVPLATSPAGPPRDLIVELPMESQFVTWYEVEGSTPESAPAVTDPRDDVADSVSSPLAIDRLMADWEEG